MFPEKWIGKNWREVHLYLHEDSTLMWYSGSDPEGGVLLRDAPEMLAVGQVQFIHIICIFTLKNTEFVTNLDLLTKMIILKSVLTAIAASIIS